MRRRNSIVGPAVLILGGAILLVHNLAPEAPLMEMLGRFWPFLLIAWGTVRLVEVLVWASTARPLPRTGITGGEWAVVIILSLVGSGFYASRRMSSWMPQGRSLKGLALNIGESFDYNIEPVSRTAEKAPRIVIENFRGNAHINGADGDKVSVSGHKAIQALQQSEADSANQNTPVELVVQGNDIIVRTNQDRVNGNMQASAELEITVPRGSSIDAHGKKGDFDIRDIQGTVDLHSDNAGVRMEKIGGNIQIDLKRSDLVRISDVLGSVELKGHGADVELQQIKGPVSVNGDFLGQVQLHDLAEPVHWLGINVDLQLERLVGQVHMAPREFSANDVGGPVRLTSKSRDVEITGFKQALEISLDRGDVTLRPGTKDVPKMEVRTKSGNIDLALASGVRMDLRAMTHHGSVSNDFSDALKVKEEHNRGEISSEEGSGPQVRLETNRGSVTVRKADSDGGSNLQVKEQ